MNTEQMQTAIITKTVEDLINAGFYLAVFDSEEITTPITKNKEVIINALQTTDEDVLYCYSSPDTGRNGFVMFVYGNDGYDVICDYSTNLESALTAVNALSNDFCEQFA